MAVSNPRGTSRSTHPRMVAVRIASATLVAVAIGGLVAIGPLQQPSADAAASGSSALSVKWVSDNSSAQAVQPTRDASSPHYNEFKKIAISVSQTSGIIDQAIRVSVTGFAGTRSSTQSGAAATNAMNYLQAMQCWGTDPSAADFSHTCLWGARALTENNGLGDSVIPDNALRVGPLDLDPAHPTTHDVPFLTVGGVTVSGKPHLTASGVSQYDILDYFGPSTTNEVTSARVGDTGNGFFDFETQTSKQAPQMGCGTPEHLRCWLVVVPRGTVFGGDGEQCSGIREPANNFALYTVDRPNSIQGGSPVNDLCDYWKNRIVVPLDFAPTGSTCVVGSSEVRVIGSQLMVSAMSSWQPSLCTTVKSTFSFSTNPDSVARAQLIETGVTTPNIAYSGYPVSAGELLTDGERQVLSKTKLRYAPVAISSVVIAFNAEFDGGRQEHLNISPRLMAKLLTQSYTFTVPQSVSEPTKQVAQLPGVNRKYHYLSDDPDFQAMNPTNYKQFTSDPAIVLPGPAGADAIRQVWRWILADKDAVAFLNGAADPSGMTINPYYLPKGDPGAVVPWYLDSANNYLETPVQRNVGLTNLDGSPKKLTLLNLDTFPKNDETLAPLKLSNERLRFDSIQFAPYTDNLLTAARQAFRANPNSKSYWDPYKVTDGAGVGDWVSSGTQLPGSKFMIAITDSPSAARYGLSTAAIGVPNNPATVVSADAAGMTNALVALAPTSLDTVKQIDPALVPDNGYPMTIVTYAGVNLTKASPAARSTITDMLKQVTTSGQVSGSAIGNLPAGYLPLTADMVSQASAAADDIKSYVPTASNSGNTNSGAYAHDTYDSSVAAAGAGLSSGSGATPVLTPGADSLKTDRTAVSSTEPIARSGLAIALGIGLVGFLIAPFLFRGRGFL